MDPVEAPFSGARERAFLVRNMPVLIGNVKIAAFRGNYVRYTSSAPALALLNRAIASNGRESQRGNLLSVANPPCTRDYSCEPTRSDVMVRRAARCQPRCQAVQCQLAT